MSLEDTLKTTADNIGNAIVKSEAQVKQFVILPILQALGWNPFDAAEVVPEMPMVLDMSTTSSGFVDYALRDGFGKPLVFIEAKRVGGASESGEEQVFNYANHKGVPFLILTDGDSWNFYLSMAEGTRPERRFYRAELLQKEKHGEYAKMFKSYLGKERVVSGDAKRAAEKSHESNREKAKVGKIIPVVWRKLMAEPDEMLRDVLAEAVESECGIKPALDDVESFLQGENQPVPTPVSVHHPQPITKTALLSPRKGNKKIAGFVLDGREVREKHGNRVLAEVLNEFQKRDPGFLPRFAQETIGRTRRLVAQARDELYDYANLTEYSVELENGWWLGTNLSTGGVRKNIEIACQIAGIKFGTQLTLIER